MRELPVLETIRTALRVLTARPGHFASLIVVPALISVFLALREREADDIWNLMLAVLGLLPLVLFAVWCHRSILLDASRVHAFGSLAWGERENRFIVWILCIQWILVPAAAVGLLGPIWLVARLLGVAIPWQGESPVWLGAAGAVFILPVSYVLARSLFVLPATAVDLRPSLSSAWRLSHGNGWRLAMLVVVLPSSLYVIAGAAVDASTSSHGAQVIGGVVSNYVIGLFEVALLSVSFRSLASDELFSHVN